MRQRLVLAIGLLLALCSTVDAQYSVMPWARAEFYSNNGTPCSGCKLYAFAAGTVTPLDTYQTSGGTANAHPIILNSAGRPSASGVEVGIFLSSNSYKFRLDTAADVPIWTQDNVTATHAGITGITSTSDVTVQLDSDNDGANNKITVLNSTGVEKFRVDETGDVQLDDDLTIGDATEADHDLIFDGNAQDYYACLDDSADEFVIGRGSACGTTPALKIATTGDVTLTGLLTANTLGTHTFVGTGVGANILRVQSATAGSGNYGALQVGTDFSAALLAINAYSSTSTAGGREVPNGALIEVLGAGGLSISAFNAAGDIRFYTTASATLRGTMFDTGGFSWGDATDPGATNLRVAGTGIFGSASSGGANLQLGPAVPSANSSGAIHFLNSDSVKNWKLSTNDIETGAFELTQSTAAGGSTWAAAPTFRISNLGAVSLAGANVTDAVTTPTISAGFGGSPTIAGKVFAFRVTVGSGNPTTGTVAFNTTLANAAACVASSSDPTSGALGVVGTTTTVAFSSAAALPVGTIVSVLCRGF